MNIQSILRSMLRVMACCCLPAIVTSAQSNSVKIQASQWVRPGGPDQPLIWGRRDGIVFGLASSGGMRGPRGLIRVGVFKPGQAQPELLNFIAVEPVVAGPGDRFDRMAFSELEMSQLDPGQRGKRMTVAEGVGHAASVSGVLETLQSGRSKVERLSVKIEIERYQANGAHVYVIASIDADHPDELRLTPYAEADSVPLEESVVTATMGNFERLRLLWLNDQVIDSRSLFSDYTGTAFTEKSSYPLPTLLRTDDGGAIVFCTSNEPSPAESPGNTVEHWVYTLPRYTQYWRVRGSDVQPDLRARVNARRVYWNSITPVPGGVAFENFEVRQRYIPGATFVFGIARMEPRDLYKGPGTLKAWTNPPSPADDHHQGAADAADGKSAK